MEARPRRGRMRFQMPVAKLSAPRFTSRISQAAERWRRRRSTPIDFVDRVFPATDMCGRESELDSAGVLLATPHPYRFLNISGGTLRTEKRTPGGSVIHLDWPRFNVFFGSFA